MAYVVFKDLPRRIASDKVLPDKAFNIIKNPKYYGYQRGLPSIVYSFLGKKSSGSAAKTKLCHTKNQQKNYANQLLENLTNEKYIHLLWIMFGVLILQICN